MNAQIIGNMRTLLDKPDLAETYTFICLYFNCYGYMPSMAEVGAHFGITGNGACRRVVRLKRLGYVRLPFGVHRGIKLIGWSAA